MLRICLGCFGDEADGPETTSTTGTPERGFGGAASTGRACGRLERGSSFVEGCCSGLIGSGMLGRFAWSWVMEAGTITGVRSGGTSGSPADEVITWSQLRTTAAAISSDLYGVATRDKRCDVTRDKRRASTSCGGQPQQLTGDPDRPHRSNQVRQAIPSRSTVKQPGSPCLRRDVQRGNKNGVHWEVSADIDRWLGCR